MHSWRDTTIIVVIATILGGVAGYFIGTTMTSDSYDQQLSEIHPVRDADKAFPLINPLLTYDLPQSRFIREDVDMKAHLEQVIDRIKRDGDITGISIYFKQLGSGKWLGIGENNTYSPASLLKVMLMIAYYRQVENNPSFADHELKYTPAIEKMNTFLPYASSSLLKVGGKYAPEDLVRRMIIESDNGALNMLYANMDSHALDEVSSDLGIPIPEGTSGTYTISAKQYSLFFRVLYNSTYLSREHSNMALKFLSEAEYNTALGAGIPKNVLVAHKYGEHLALGQNNRITGVELHDCGIVYAPNAPYFLCVMTRGTALVKQADAIGKISKDVYESITKNTEKK